MLRVRGLSKTYLGREVLKDIDLSIAAGEVVGLIGLSGAGKSTLARCLVGLEKMDRGSIQLNGDCIVPGKGTARRSIQYLWQDPARSLSPYLSAMGAVMETLAGFGLRVGPGKQARATELLSSLGLPKEMHGHHPHALSGGQNQRVALARALAAEPQVLVLDEPLSSLDLATQVSTIAVLRDIHAQTGLAMLIVSHDLAPLRHLADHVLVLDGARIVEDISMSRFSLEAKHPLARAYVETLGMK